MKASLKYIYLALATILFVVSFVGAITGAIGWNAKTLSYLIDSQFFGVSAGLCISLTALLVAVSLHESYKQKRWFVLGSSIVALCCLIVADGWLSIEAFNVTDEAAKNDALANVHDSGLQLLLESARLDLKDAERIHKMLPDEPAYKGTYNRAKAKADSLQGVYIAAENRKILRAENFRKDRPFTKYIGGLALILAANIGIIVSRVFYDKYRVIVRRENKIALKRAENDRERQELESLQDDWIVRLRRSENDLDAVKSILLEYYLEYGEWADDVKAVAKSIVPHEMVLSRIRKKGKEANSAVISANKHTNSKVVEASKNGHANTLSS